MSLGDRWEDRSKKALINGTVCGRLALAKPMDPYRSRICCWPSRLKSNGSGTNRPYETFNPNDGKQTTSEQPLKKAAVLFLEKAFKGVSTQWV